MQQKTKHIEHKFRPEVRQHIAEAGAQINDHNAHILLLEGECRRREREVAQIQKHISVLIELQRQMEGLPAGEYKLSKDGSAIVADVLEKEEGNGVAQ